MWLGTQLGAEPAGHSQGVHIEPLHLGGGVEWSLGFSPLPKAQRGASKADFCTMLKQEGTAITLVARKRMIIQLGTVSKEWLKIKGLHRSSD